MEDNGKFPVSKPKQAVLYGIMARKGIDSWKPLCSNGKTIRFLSQGEADAYMNSWLARKGGGWKAFSFSEIVDIER